MARLPTGGFGVRAALGGRGVDGDGRPSWWVASGSCVYINMVHFPVSRSVVVEACPAPVAGWRMAHGGGAGVAGIRHRDAAPRTNTICTTSIPTQCTVGCTSSGTAKGNRVHEDFSTCGGV